MAGTASFLLVLNEASGKICSDETVNNRDGTIRATAVEGVDFVWHPGEGTLNGFLSLNHDGGGGGPMPWISHTGWSTTDNTEPQSLCIGFSLATLPESQVSLFGNGGGASNDNGVMVWATAPAGAGDFDLHMNFRLSGFTPGEYVESGLTFGTVYALSVRGKNDGTNTHLGYSLNGGTIASKTGGAFNGSFTATTYIGRSEFADNFGVDGNVYYAAYWRNEFLSDADMESFAADPTQIPDWPAAGTPDPTLTDLDTDEVITEGQTGIAVTGTDLGTTNANRTFSLVQGSVEVDQTETGTGTSTAAAISAVIDSTTDIKFGAATFRVTRDDLATADLAVTVNPAAGEIYVDLTSIHATSSERITAVPDLAIGDQLHARGEGGGAAPTGLSLNADGTFQFAAGSTPANFEVRAWDASDSTWGAFAVQSLGGVVTERTLTDSILVIDTGDELRQRARQSEDSAAVTDLASAARNRLRNTLSGILVVDEAIPLRQRLRDLLDVLATTDALTIEGQDEGGAVINSRTLQDNLAVSDLIVKLRLRRRLIQSELLVTDSASVDKARRKILEDVLAVTDDALRSFKAVRSLQSFLEVQDESVSLRLRDRMTQDEATVIDSITAAYITEIFNSLILHGFEIRPILTGVEVENIKISIDEEIG